jgi:hypothetical protein
MRRAAVLLAPALALGCAPKPLAERVPGRYVARGGMGQSMMTLELRPDGRAVFTTSTPQGIAQSAGDYTTAGDSVYATLRRAGEPDPVPLAITATIHGDTLRGVMGSEGERHPTAPFVRER